MHKLIEQFLSQFTKDEIAEAQAGKDKRRAKNLADLEESIDTGYPIGGRLRAMVRNIESVDGDGLAMETLSMFAAQHDLDLGDVLKAAQQKNPQDAILKLLRK